MRHHVPPEEKLYTWWSYRARDWQASNRGRRLDHIWATPELARLSRGIEVVREARGWQQPSDHVPVDGDARFQHSSWRLSAGAAHPGRKKPRALSNMLRTRSNSLIDAASLRASA